jgi:L-alanine-DL-glutamate epimerase-like enolase superfamily enzyme
MVDTIENVMNIIRTELIGLNIPLSKPIYMAGRSYANAETVIIRITGENGAHGYGEAASSPYLTGETTASIFGAGELISEALHGLETSDLHGLRRIISNAIAGNSGVKAGFDMAVHDLVAKAAGKPVYELLGGLKQKSQPALVLIGSGVQHLDVENAKERQREGYRLFKLKVANGSVESDIATMFALREALGDEAKISADANGGWSYEEALHFLKSVAAMNPHFVEQPVAPDSSDALARLIENVPVPIGIDEGLHSAHELQFYVNRPGTGGLSLKLLKFGGLAQTCTAFHLCNDHNLRVNMSGKVGETGIANIAALHVACACGTADWGFSATNQYLVCDVVENKMPMNDGEIHLTGQLGLGVDISEEFMEKYTVYKVDRIKESLREKVIQ